MSVYSLYQTTNLINGKVYIGVHHEQKYPSVDWYLGSGLLLKKAIHKYGRESFERKILCVGTAPYVYELEKQIVNKEFFENSNTYNLCEGGLGPTGFSQESLQKMRDAQLGKILSSETRKRMSEARKGKSHSKETIQKIIRSNLNRTDKEKQLATAKKSKSLIGNQNARGAIRSEETRKKMSESKKGNKNPSFGRKMSIEQIAKRTATRKLNKLKKANEII